MARRGFLPQAFQAGKAAMHIPGFRSWGELDSLPIYLVGDAGAQVKVTTVGGSVTGFWGAQAVVEKILYGNTYSVAQRSLKRELDLHWFIRELLEQLDNPGYDQLLGLINANVIQFLENRNRDQMAGAFWRLLYLQPRFIQFGLQVATKWLLTNSSGYTRVFEKRKRGVSL
jgi:flavin-dependent dehydrogenase